MTTDITVFPTEWLERLLETALLHPSIVAFTPAELESELKRRWEKEPPLLAWRVTVDDMRGIVFAATHSKAKLAALYAYWEVYGRQRGEWPGVSAVRAPEFDKSRVAEAPWRARGRVFSEEYLLK